MTGIVGAGCGVGLPRSAKDATGIGGLMVTAADEGVGGETGALAAETPSSIFPSMVLLTGAGVGRGGGGTRILCAHFGQLTFFPAASSGTCNR
jgi:hypothetical protein